MSDAAAKTAGLLRGLWEKNLPVLRERVGLLERAAEEAAAGRLSEALRVEAAGVAHKLAGSLGMFGYQDGTLAARELEVALGVSPVDAMTLGRLVRALREALPLQAS